MRLSGENRLLKEQQNDENACVHLGILTYLVAPFRKGVYVDESGNT